MVDQAGVSRCAEMAIDKAGERQLGAQ